VCDVLKRLSHPDNIYYACCDAAIAEMPPKKKYARTDTFGGCRQAGLALDAGLLGEPPMEPSVGDAVSSALVELLAFEILWGFLTPRLAQRICAAAVADGLKNIDVDRMSRMGSNGAFSGNGWRDFKRMLEPSMIRKALGSFRVSIRVPPMWRKRIDLKTLWPINYFRRCTSITGTCSSPGFAAVLFRN
jgi:hypothetical protein